MDLEGLQTIEIPKFFFTPSPQEPIFSSWQWHWKRIAWREEGDRVSCIGSWAPRHPHGHHHWQGAAQPLEQAWEGSQDLSPPWIKKEAGEGGRLSLELQVSEEPDTEVMSFLGDGAYSLAFDGSLENRTLSSDGIRVWAFQVMETVERK